MKDRLFRRTGMVLILLIAVIATGGLMGCSGSDGSNGANGANGTPGTPGTNGTATTFGAHNLAQGNVDQTVSNIVVSNVGGVPKVSFHLATAAGPVTALAATQIRIYLSDLVPAGVVSAATGSAYSTDYFAQWASERSTTPFSTFGNSDAANGNYSWTFSAPFGTATAGSGLNNKDYNAAHVQRLVLRINGDSTVAKTNNTVATQDFTIAGATVTPFASPQRQFVTIQACQKCHSKFMDNAAHADSYLDTTACDICHSPLYSSSTHSVGFMDTANAILPVFIHQIHDSVPNPGGPTVAYPVTYPQDIKNCVTCHTNSNLTLGTGDKTGNWKNNPSGRVCASCHTNLTLNANGSMNHDPARTGAPFNEPNSSRTDAQCGTCHAPADIVGYHDTTPPPFVAPATGLVTSLTTSDTPEYIVSISTNTPANGQYFVTGETPTVTITLTNNNAGHTSVSGTLVTSGSHTVGYYDPTSLSIANMYVYGPRNSPRPSFLPGGRTDKGVAASTKNINLMTTYTSASRTPATAPTGPFTYVDPNKTITATGWKYTLAPIPAGTLPGTYFVRVHLGNTYTYNIADPVPNQVVSVGIVKFQVGTATEDLRIAGNADNTSSCLNCHGSAVMHRGDHVAIFDADHCSPCHYVGARGNTALGASAGTAPTSNRVHAVHSASATGDISVINWSVPNEWNVEVRGFPTSTITYPQNLRCNTCHSSGNTSYKSNLYEIPCFGCHADVPGATAHMTTNGGNLNSIVSGTTGTTTVPESCVVCHSSGNVADISD